MRRLRYSSEARSDLLAILIYIARETGSRTLGRRHVDRIRARCSKLATLPGVLGRARPELREDLRSFAVGHHVVFFRYGDGVLDIVAVVEGHRDLDALLGNGNQE